MTSSAPGPRSRALARRAARVLVGGVDSPVRSFRAVGGSPVFFARGRGAYLEDVDGRRYLDLVGSWGANLLGNAPPPIVAAVRRTVVRGLTFGAPSPLEHELAERIRRAAPALERLRFVSSGTEAVMSAVRVARGFTHRTKVVKFAGGYHGHSDGLLARAGSGVATLALPDSAGVPRAIVGETFVARYNDAEGLATLFERRGASIAAVVVEPVAGNMGVVPPRSGFLAKLSSLARRHGALVIADEVITGFRLRHGTVHGSLGLHADLVTLGKVVGGGMPVGVYGGRRDVMEMVAPLGPVYQAGTLSGNPLAMAAGAAMLDRLTPAVYRELERTGASLEERLVRLAEEERVRPFTVQRVGSMVGLFFAPGPIRDDREAERTDRARYARFFHAALDRGVYLPPSALETTFLSAAVRSRDLSRAEPGLRAAFRAARGGRA
ncbi:MAG: glutamate-1-semialdehyde 2,1-aminomutase [Thermoplasmata archaeon]